MHITRRDFLKVSSASLAVAALGFDLSGVNAQVQELRIQSAKVTPTICPFCSAGCGLVVHTDTAKGHVLYTEGDPDHPINAGAACSKGASVFQLNSISVGKINPNRLTKPLYRAPGGEAFQEVGWDWALEQIVNRVKVTRDNNFIAAQNGIPVMRTEAIANLGGAALDDEECYLLQKLARALGIVYLEHQARI